MRRKQVYLTEELNDGIKRLAAAEGRTESEIIREAIGTYLAARRDDKDPWQSLVGIVPEGAKDESMRVDEVVYGVGERKR